MNILLHDVLDTFSCFLFLSNVCSIFYLLFCCVTFCMTFFTSFLLHSVLLCISMGLCRICFPNSASWLFTYNSPVSARSISHAKLHLLDYAIMLIILIHVFQFHVVYSVSMILDQGLILYIYMGLTIDLHVSLAFTVDKDPLLMIISFIFLLHFYVGPEINSTMLTEALPMYFWVKFSSQIHVLGGIIKT